MIREKAVYQKIEHKGGVVTATHVENVPQPYSRSEVFCLSVAYSNMPSGRYRYLDIGCQERRSPSLMMLMERVEKVVGELAETVAL